MKKIMMILLIATLAFVAIGCEKDNVSENNETVITDENNVTEENENTVEENTNVEEDADLDENIQALSLEEIVSKMYEMTELQFPKTMISELTADNMVYMVGVDNFDYLEGIVSEPMMTSQAHSIVLFTVEEGSDIETIKSDIKANVDGRKWICVSVDDENILVENVGNTIVLIMDENSEALMTAFKSIMN